jgi:hypothetical protein
MSGISFAYRLPGNNPVPIIREYRVAKSLSGSGAIYRGDLLVLDSGDSYKTTTGSLNVARRLLAADKTGEYEKDTDNTDAGVLGLAIEGYTTNSSGVINGNPWGGGSQPIMQVPAPGALAVDPYTGHSLIPVILATPDTVFRARLNINTTDWTAASALGHQYDSTRKGLIITANGNDLVYSIDLTPASAEFQILEIIGPDEGDPLYNKALTGTAADSSNDIADATKGPFVFFRFLEGFCQSLNNNDYDTD